MREAAERAGVVGASNGSKRSGETNVGLGIAVDGSRESAPSGVAPPSVAADRDRTTVRPFLLGTVVGGVAGAVAGTLLSYQTRRLIVGLIHVTGRRLTAAERDELRFELLLQ